MTKGDAPVYKPSPPPHSTLYDEIVTLRQVLKTAIRYGWLRHLPDLSPPYRTEGKSCTVRGSVTWNISSFTRATREYVKIAREDHCWEAEQLHDLVLFLGNTGLRPNEARNLDEASGGVDAGQEVDGALVLSCGDGAELFELAAEVFDEVAFFVEFAIVGARSRAAGDAGDHRGFAGRQQGYNHALVGVVGPVRQEGVGLQRGHAARGSEKGDRERIYRGADEGQSRVRQAVCLTGRTKGSSRLRTRTNVEIVEMIRWVDDQRKHKSS